ncbi:MAG: hypothetical protein Roseis2KO_34560 [Roseivirga sp.]
MIWALPSGGLNKILYQFDYKMTQIELKLLLFDQGEKRGRSSATTEFINEEQAVRNEL